MKPCFPVGRVLVSKFPCRKLRFSASIFNIVNSNVSSFLVVYAFQSFHELLDVIFANSVFNSLVLRLTNFLSSIGSFTNVGTV